MFFVWIYEMEKFKPFRFDFQPMGGGGGYLFVTGRSHFYSASDRP